MERAKLKFVNSTGKGAYDAQPFWSGTPEQFYKLYETVARVLKSYDPSLKVGAPGLAFGGMPGPYREGLIEYCAVHHVPLDFYSWHHFTQGYADPYDLVRIARDIRGLLDAKELRNSENHLTEWAMSLPHDPKFRSPPGRGHRPYS
jgi:xylan 1,4-beta-xylosidase